MLTNHQKGKAVPICQADIMFWIKKIVVIGCRGLKFNTDKTSLSQFHFLLYQIPTFFVIFSWIVAIITPHEAFNVLFGIISYLQIYYLIYCIETGVWMKVKVLFSLFYSAFKFFLLLFVLNVNNADWYW